MVCLSFNKIMNTNKFKYIVAMLIILLVFGTCSKCANLITRKNKERMVPNSVKNAVIKKERKTHWVTGGLCNIMTQSHAESICKSNKCEGEPTIEKACNKITCYKCITNGKCHGNC